jgi:spore germination cell wall hydrolase CwlJ-like protein
MRVTIRRSVLRAALSTALFAALGSTTAVAGSEGAKVAGNEVARVLNQERALFRSASGARITELSVLRPRSRDGDAEVVVASRDVAPGTSADIAAAARKAVVLKELDLAALDALPSVSGGSDWHCLAQAIYFEARGEPLAGQIGVAEVVLNRVDDPRFPNTVCGVTYQACQFSYVCDGNSDTMKSSLARQRSEKLASLMLAGRARSVTDGATYFHSRAVSPSWSRRFTRTTTIGHHMFYRAGTRVAGG